LYARFEKLAVFTALLWENLANLQLESGKRSTPATRPNPVVFRIVNSHLSHRSEGSKRNNPVRKDGTAQDGTAQVGTSQDGTAQVGTSQDGIAQVGTAQVGTAQVGTAQVGTSQDGTSAIFFTFEPCGVKVQCLA
jgi:hypothetical protein